MVDLAPAYAQQRLMHERSGSVKNLADIIQLHRDEHTRDWLTGACQEAIATRNLEAGLQRFLRLAD